MTPAHADSVNHIASDLEVSFDFDIEIREEALNQLKEALAAAPIDIREPLQGFVTNADRYQEKVIQSQEETIRVVAPAGSGKTQTILNRVLQRVREGLNPERILIVTFDNAAASSLLTKLRAQLEELNLTLNTLRIRTLNAYGYELLRQYFSDEYKPVIPDYRPRKLVQEIKGALKTKSPERHQLLPKGIKDRFYTEFFSLLKNELFDPRRLDPQQLADFIMKSPQAKPFFDSGTGKSVVKQVIEAVIWLFMAYERTLQRENYLDFDDQKLRPYICLKNSTEICEALQGKFSEIIVDEFQDINRLDFALVKLLAERCTLVVTGDDDQAIYGFRNCSPDYIIDLDKYLNRKIASFELKVNYRNPANLVEHSARLIRHNTRRIPKDPIPNVNQRAEIKVVSSLSAGLEAKLIVSFIQKVRRSHGHLNFRDFAVLYRTNAQSLPLQVEFILSEIPYYVRQQDNILENEVLDRLLGFLKLKLRIQEGLQPSAHDAVLTLQAYFKFLLPVTSNRLHQYFERATDFFEALTTDEILNIAPFIGQSNLLPAIREAVSAASLMDTLNVVAKHFKGVRGMIGSLDEAMEERMPLGEIFELAANFKGNTWQFVKTIEGALESARRTRAGNDQEQGVALLTYFKSKGLQWHSVILTSCNEGIIPHSRAPIEDERRLFYVAMTRASSNLLVSYVKRACNNAVIPSRFIREAGLFG
jgi:DNA helicase II / ATP-dependent DNA helicase PcrA